jgi:hypothetical protein
MGDGVGLALGLGPALGPGLTVAATLGVRVADAVGLGLAGVAERTGA